ncbi:hypothetical protein Tco_0221501 [Tanacetum coccineum]
MNRYVQKNLYNALIESYNSDKDLFASYGDVVTLKRGRDDQDKDEEPSAGSNRGTKRMRSNKEESSKEATQKESKSTSSSKGSQTPNREWNKTKTVDDRPLQSWMTQLAQASGTQSSFNEFLATPIDFSAFIITRLKINNLTQDVLTDPTYDLMKDTCKIIVELEYHLEENVRGHQVIPFDHFINNDLEYLKRESLSQRCTTSITKTKAAKYSHVKWIEDKVPRSIWSSVQVVYDKHAYWGTYHWDPKHQSFYGYTTNMETSKDVYSRHKIIVVTSLKIMEFFSYKNLEEIIVRRQDDQLYKFQEGDFKRLRCQDIEDMLLFLVQGKLTNLNLDERFALNVALRMYTRRIVIQERVEDLQLAVESYQKKINLSRPDSYHDMDRNRLMRTDELHKFSDGTLNHVRTALNDIATGIQMEYLPKRKWTKQDKQRARVMINAIDKKLRDRRLMRSLEKFVGGRPYRGDLRLLQRTI